MRVREMIYTLYFYGSPYYKNKNLHYRKKVFNQKKYSRHAEYFFRPPPP